MAKNVAPFFWVGMTNLVLSFNSEKKKYYWARTRYGLSGRIGTNACAIYAALSHMCYVGVSLRIVKGRRRKRMLHPTHVGHF